MLHTKLLKRWKLLLMINRPKRELVSQPVYQMTFMNQRYQDMCVKRCDQIHKTFLQRLANTAGGLAKEVVKEASGVAGEGLGGFLDGVFGDGMGIPSAIGIFVFIMIVMVLVSTM